MLLPKKFTIFAAEFSTDRKQRRFFRHLTEVYYIKNVYLFNKTKEK